jgi:neutral ceramidase
LYGPHTLDAYIQTAVQLAQDMASGRQRPRGTNQPAPLQQRGPAQPLIGPQRLVAAAGAPLDVVAGAAAAAVAAPPLDFASKVLSFLPPVVMDGVPYRHAFGEVIQQPRDAGTPYRAGETVEVEFWGANPRNNLRRGGTFLEVQRWQAQQQQQQGQAQGQAQGEDPDASSGSWVKVHTDDDWSTKFVWGRPRPSTAAGRQASTLLLPSASTATITWAVPQGALPGVYRVVYNGDAKGLLGGITPFRGASRAFTVA